MGDGKEGSEDASPPLPSLNLSYLPLPSAHDKREGEVVNLKAICVHCLDHTSGPPLPHEYHILTDRHIVVYK